MENQTAVNKTPLILGIVSVVVTIIPLIGCIAGLVLGIIAFSGGKKAMAEANARPDRAGIVVAIVGKWMGFGGIIQNAILLAYYLFVLFLFLVVGTAAAR